MKRFYITNSLMTYHPTAILKTALFFATKTENHYFRLTKFADAIGKTKAEDVLASEFLLTQGLRFTFDVRHPFRALEGAVMELQAMASGTVPSLPGTEPVIPPPELNNMKKRVREAHGKAREYLKTSALLTDVYFHYTPSQIMFASLLIADEELTKWYLGTKFPPTSTSLYETLLLALRRCADALLAVPPTSEPSAVEMKELKKLSKKLQKCQNPDMVDLVKVNEQKKREGNDSGLDEKVIKKRKLEREKNMKEGEELFGPALGKPKDDNGPR
jgi:cyclin H